MQNTNEDYVVVFKSRTQTMKFYDYLKRNKVYTEIINTPRHLSLGCGLSIKFNVRQEEYIHRALKDLNLYSFGGIFPLR